MNRRDAIKSAVLGAAAIWLTPIKSAAAALKPTARWHKVWVLTTYPAGPSSVCCSFHDSGLEAYRVMRRLQAKQWKKPKISTVHFYGTSVHEPAEHVKFYDHIFTYENQ